MYIVYDICYHTEKGYINVPSLLDAVEDSTFPCSEGRVEWDKKVNHHLNMISLDYTQSYWAPDSLISLRHYAGDGYFLTQYKIYRLLSIEQSISPNMCKILLRFYALIISSYNIGKSVDTETQQHTAKYTTQYYPIMSLQYNRSQSVL